MIKKEWWIDFYGGTLENTTLTVDVEPVYNFITYFLPQKNKLNIFDQCCGRGYLTNEFAKNNNKALGIDLSKAHIDFANEKFANKNCKFICTDAKKYVSNNKFDLAINWNTSFGYEENDEENFKILKKLSDNLKFGGIFIISTINPDFIKNNFQKYLTRDFKKNGKIIKCTKESFLEGNMLKSHWHIFEDNNKKIIKSGQTKLYSVYELNTILLKYNLFIENLYGDINFTNYNEDSPNMIIYGKKNEY